MQSRRALIGWMAAAWLAAGGSGCIKPRSERPVQPSTPPSSDLGETGRPSLGPQAAGGDGLTVVELHFDVMRVELPAEPLRHSTKIWNHVNELQMSPARSALLSRNGFRVGVADPDAWPPIQAILNANGAKSSRKQHAVQSGYPLTLDLGTVGEGEAIFSYDHDGNLTGRTYDAGSKYLHVEYGLEIDGPRRVTLKITPEIHAESPNKLWTYRNGAYQEEPRYTGCVFGDVAATVSLSDGQFLVIGPSEHADLECLLGSRFLERRERETRYETLLFATPQLFRAVVTER